MPVPYLRAVHNVRPFIIGIIKRRDRIRQYHEPAAKPANMLIADKTDSGLGKPLYQPIDTIKHNGHRNGQADDVNNRRATNTAPFFDVGLHNIEKTKQLPEEKNPYQDKSIALGQSAIAEEAYTANRKAVMAAESPNSTGKNEYGEDSKAQGETV